MLKRPISLVWARTSRLFTRQYDAKAAAAAALKEAEEAERELASKRRDVGRVTITLVTEEGREYKVHTRPGERLHAAVLRTGIPELPCVCTGKMVCTTCHVYIPNQRALNIPPAKEDENDMIDIAGAPRDDSRLLCQVVATREMNDTIMFIPSVSIDHMDADSTEYRTSDLAKGVKMKSDSAS